MLGVSVLAILYIVACSRCCGSGLAGGETNVIAASEWSEPVEQHDHSVRGRVIVCEGRSPAYAGEGQEVLVYLELENVTRSWGQPLKLYCDPMGGARYELSDANGRRVPPAPTAGSGGAPAAYWITLPYDSSVRLRANPGGWGTPQNAALALPMRPMAGDYWLIKHGDTNEYFLSATFTVASPKNGASSAEDRSWEGTLKMPKVKISVMKH
jgi:hypothetical protein